MVALRYPLAPLVALVLLAVLPLAPMTWLLLWSDSRADAHESAATALPATYVPIGDPTPALSTGVLSARRMPSSLARLAAEAQLATSMGQLAAFLDDRSCLAVAVDGRSVGSWNGDVAVIPASTNKLLVAGAAVEILGAEFRFTTSIVATRPVNGVVDGDLTLVGGGDPVLTTADRPNDANAPNAAAATPLEVLADAVVASGVRSISGAIVGDAGRYDDEFVNPAWASGVAYLEAGPIGGLLVNDGRTAGQWSRQRDPGEAAARELWRLLRDRNVDVAEGWRAGAVDAGLPTIATVESAPLAAIVGDMLVRSDNDTAEMLLKEIGRATADTGTTEAGLRALELTVESWGVDMQRVVLVDGSGLGASNKLTCDVLLAVLQHLSDTSFVGQLAVAGRSGTLIDEFLGTAVEGRLMAKTGTLRNLPTGVDPPEVKALAGYLDVPSGETIEFALVLNGDGSVTDGAYRPLWQALAERLASFPVGPVSDALGPRRGP